MSLTESSSVVSSTYTDKLKNCSPLKIADLALKVKHKRRALICTIISKPLNLNSFSALIEDSDGTESKLKILNNRSGEPIPETYLTVGQKIGILEPYLKQLVDEVVVICIDNPQKLVFLENVKSSSKLNLDEVNLDGVISKQNEGNAFFARGLYKDAVASYTDAISNLNRDRCLLNILNNIAASYQSLLKHECSLFFSIAALSVSPNNEKSILRAAHSLKSLGRNDEAQWCIEQQKKRKSSHLPDSKALPFVKYCASVWDTVVKDDAFMNRASSPSAKAEDCKDRGNTFFNQKRYEDALIEYYCGLGSLKQASVLFSNQAASNLKLTNFLNALQDSTAALVVDPFNAKASHRTLIALLELEELNSSELFSDICFDLNLMGNDNAFLSIRDRIQLSIDLSRQIQLGQRSESVASRKFLDRKLFDAHNKLSRNNNELKAMNAMLEYSENCGGESILDSRVTKFHLAYASRGQWPAGCNVQRCKNHLEKVFEESRSMKTHELSLFNQLERPDELSILQRLGSNEEDAIEWYYTAEYSDVRDVKSKRTYDTSIFHSFSNNWNRPVKLTLGTPHVAVGFVDLGELREAALLRKEFCGPLTWIGYELSAYCAAKTMVIAEMFKESAPTDCILQAWYSSTWSLSTLKSFREAIGNLVIMDSIHMPALQSSEVLELLRCWMIHDVTLSHARSCWLDTAPVSEIANFIHDVDKLALCDYILTGQLLDGCTGSVAMFSIPDSLHIIRSVQQDVFYTIGEDILFKNRDAGAVDIVSALIEHLRESIKKLSHHFEQNEVVVVIHHQSLDLTNTELLSSIRQLNAYTMSWNNVLDYFPRAEFHALAQACSGPDTLHFGYSMNWPLLVKGSSCIDACYTRKFLKMLFDETIKCIKTLLSQDVRFKYIICPPIDNARNTVDYGLFSNHYKLWIKSFFAAAGMDDYEKQVPCADLDSYRIFSRARSTIFLTFTYDKSMTFIGSGIK